MPLHGDHKFGYRTFFNKEQPKLSEKKKLAYPEKMQQHGR